MTNITSSSFGFCGHFTTINSHGPEPLNLTNFLCGDLDQKSPQESQIAYDVTIDIERDIFALYKFEELLYSGNQTYDLAYTLINELLYQCIVDNDFGQAIHAAAIDSSLGGVLIPGTSGSGKSTFTTWLASCGCNYLTDELVILSGKPTHIHPFTRPISLKNGSLPTMCSYVNCTHQDVIIGTNGAMFPHRLINENYTPTKPPLALIIFPKYNPNAQNELLQLPKALGCAELIKCFVNARKFGDHGMGDIAEISRKVPMFQLTYSSFDRLYELLSNSFPKLF